MKPIEKTKEALDLISPSFCLAKWYQVTIHLQNGTTHSCHHPATHKIPLEELKDNPSALHNTKYKKEQRRLMLEGKRPAECSYCWNIEDSGPSYSDRHYKSNDSWAFPHLAEAVNAPWDADINPRYVEVSFGNTCNFKCSYCSPLYSSKWADEIKQEGPYPTSGKFNDMSYYAQNNLMPILEREENPYVDAFWKWWPELYKSLHTFRITGGEPLLNKNTFRVLDYVVENPNPNLILAINSNLGIPDVMLDKFIDSTKKILTTATKPFILYTSVDTYGAAAEYIRHGLDYKKFIANCERVLTELPGIRMVFMCTFNALSIPDFKPFLDEVVRLKKTYNNGNPQRFMLDMPYLRYPEHQAIRILTPDFAEHVRGLIMYMEVHKDVFLEHEIAKFHRIYDWMISPPDSESKLENLRSDFYAFMTEHDRRRGTNFLQTFPTMKEFFALCERDHDAVKARLAARHV